MKSETVMKRLIFTVAPSPCFVLVLDLVVVLDLIPLAQSREPTAPQPIINRQSTDITTACSRLIPLIPGRSRLHANFAGTSGFFCRTATTATLGLPLASPFIGNCFISHLPESLWGNWLGLAPFPFASAIAAAGALALDPRLSTLDRHRRSVDLRPSTPRGGVARISR